MFIVKHRCQLPYLSFAAQERYYLLITEGSQKEGVLEEINGILIMSVSTDLFMRYRWYG